MEPNPPSSIPSNSVRLKKRKLEDAIRILDDAVVPSPSAIERPTPSKRPHLPCSVYSTLAKFGTTSKRRSRPSSNTPVIDVSKSAPHLAAILARSTSQFNTASTLSHTTTLPVQSSLEYTPSSTASFLSRLATYKITTYANKPSQINAVAASRCGWINEGKDRLICGLCDVSWVVAGCGRMNKDAANTFVEKQRINLVKMHKDGCPWKVRQCEPSIYRVPLQAPAAMVHELRATAASLEPLLANVAIKHPLTPSQLRSIYSIFATESEGPISKHDLAMRTNQTTYPVGPSDDTIVVALFGWVPVQSASDSEICRISPLHVSHVGSFGLSASRPPTPSLSRASSVSSRFRERADIPTSPSASFQSSISPLRAPLERVGVSSRIKNPRTDNNTANTLPMDTSLVYCVLCHRRIGLWGYSRNKATASSAQDEQVSSASSKHQRVFDLLKEHRSYCPYIVHSSVVPSLSRSAAMDSDGNAIEGWRAVLTVVQRYELSQRQHLSRFLPSGDPYNQAPSAELKGVETMVAGVKANGGRELLRYVKGLLG